MGAARGPASRGRVVNYSEDKRFDGRRVMRTTNEIQPGNSGGPVVEGSGNVVGVVFALDVQDGFALAIPVSQLRLALQDSAMEAVVPCERG
jgi:S1-C subfamily serine protease